MTILSTNQFGEIVFFDRTFSLNESGASALAKAIYSKFPLFDSDTLKKNMSIVAESSKEHKMFIGYVVELILNIVQKKQKETVVHPAKLFNNKTFELLESKKTKNKPEIRFEFWIDPLQNSQPNDDNAISDLEENSYLEVDDELLLPEVLSTDKDVNVVPMETLVTTPLGFTSLTNQNLLSSYFNFWIGHTNFDVVKEYENLISAVQGVESFEIYTRYRFRIGVGRLFQTGKVLSNVSKVMIKYEKQKRRDCI